MKRLVLVALLCVLLGAVAFAETEDEARAALQNTLMELEETYGAELLPEEQMQLSFLIDWADRYVESEQWAQFAEDFGQCQDAQKLSELLNTDYMGINQAEEGLMQREEARQRSIEIVQAAGFDLEQMPYVSLGSKGGWNGWEVRVSQIPGMSSAHRASCWTWPTMEPSGTWSTWASPPRRPSARPSASSERRRLPLRS